MADHSKLRKFWGGQIADSMKRESKWRENGQKVVDKYKSSTNKFNILWSNTEILKAATFSRMAGPHVSRRYSNEDKVAKDASEIIERSLEFQADEDVFVRSMRQARDDMLLPGRGTIWVEYEADIEEIELESAVIPDENGEDTNVFMVAGVPIEPHFERDGAGFIERIRDQRVIPQYVYWKDYLQSNSRNEESVWWKARRHGLSRQEILEQLNLDDKRLDAIKLGSESDDKKNGSVCRLGNMVKATSNAYLVYRECGGYNQRRRCSATSYELLSSAQAFIPV